MTINLFPPTSSYSDTSGRLPAVGSEISLNQIQTFFGLEDGEEVNVSNLGKFLYNQPSAITSGNEISLSASFGGKANNFMIFILNSSSDQLVRTLPNTIMFNGRDSYLSNGSYRGFTNDGTDFYISDYTIIKYLK